MFRLYHFPGGSPRNKYDEGGSPKKPINIKKLTIGLLFLMAYELVGQSVHGRAYGQRHCAFPTCFFFSAHQWWKTIGENHTSAALPKANSKSAKTVVRNQRIISPGSLTEGKVNCSTNKAVKSP